MNNRLLQHKWLNLHTISRALLFWISALDPRVTFLPQVQRKQNRTCFDDLTDFRSLAEHVMPIKVCFTTKGEDHA